MGAPADERMRIKVRRTAHDLEIAHYKLEKLSNMMLLGILINFVLIKNSRFI